MDSTFIGSICPRSFRNTSVRRKRTSPPSSIRPPTRTGSSSSTKRTPCLASAPRPPARTIAMPTRRSPTFCSAWRIIRASSSSPPTSRPTSTTPLPAGFRPASTSRPPMTAPVAPLAEYLPQRRHLRNGTRPAPDRPRPQTHRRADRQCRAPQPLMAVERGGKVILTGDLLRGIRRELDKEGRNG